MLSGSIIHGYSYGPELSDACLRRMDGALPFPYPPEPAEQTAWASELGVAATVLLGLAWITLVLGLGWSRRTKAAAALPGAASTVLAGVAAVAIGDAGRLPIRLAVVEYRGVRGPGLDRDHDRNHDRDHDPMPAAVPLDDSDWSG